ncbi:MAG TPA: HAD family phosphatase [Gaiellaceae bacterium]|nr:HAD family phosphatase [Gaiellaceae bacterium]
MQAPKAVVLDWGGVITLLPDADDLARLGATCGLAGDSFGSAWFAHRHDYDRGVLTAAEYWRRVGLGDELLLEDVLAADADCWARPNLPVAEWLPRLKTAGFATGVLSNVPREQWARLTGVYERWFAYCDCLTLSFEVGHAKPEEAIYRSCLDCLGLAAHDVLFVDDRPENVDAAAAVGLQAILFTGVEPLREELAARYGDTVPTPP